MGPHCERESLFPALPDAVDLDFDLDGDTQIDVFVLSPGTEPPPPFEREATAAPCARMPRVAARVRADGSPLF